jgi:trigger factor
VIPHVDPKDYESFHAKPPPIELREGDVEREIEGLRRQAARMEEIADGLCASGDVVIADLKLQFLDGSALPPFENRIIDTGAGLVDGVECPDAKSKFIGTRRGAVVKVSMKLPDQFPPEHPLAEHHGKTAVTDCTVKDLRRVALPEVDSPEFLAQFGAKDAAELQANVRERLLQLLKQEQDRTLEELCVDELLERNRVTLPPAYLQRTVDAELDRIRKDAAARGVPPEQVEREILEKEGQLRASVERRLRATYLLDRLAEKLETPVSAQELEQQFVFMAQAWQVDAQKLFDQFQSQGLLPRVAEDIRRAKVRRQLRQAAAAAENDAGTTANPSEKAL